MHTLSIRKLIIGGLLLLPASLHAEDLKTIYDLAVSNDPAYRASQDAVKSAEASVEISSSNFWPSVSLSASTSDTDSDYDSDGAGTGSGTNNFSSDGTSTTIGATLSQSIFNYTDFTNHSSTKEFYAQSKAELESSLQDLIVRVATRYFAVLADQDNLEFSRAERKAISRQLDQTRQRFDVGLVAITDVHEAQARHDLSVAQGISAENQLDSSLESLRAITGQYHDSLSPLKDNTPLPRPDPDDIDAWTKIALQSNPSIIANQHYLKQLRETVSTQRAGYYPRADASLSYSSTDTDDTTTDTTTIQLSLKYNLFNGFSTSSSVKRALHDLSQGLENMERLRRDTQRQARSSYLSVIAGISRVKALNQAVISSKSALKASEAGFEVGTRTTVDVLDSRRELFRAQRDYAESRYEYILNVLLLKQAAGTLSADDIQQVNSWLK